MLFRRLFLCKLGYIGSTSTRARTRWAKHKYNIKNGGIEQSGLTDHLRKGAHHNQSLEQKLENFRMVLIDQVACEILSTMFVYFVSKKKLD